MHQAPIGLLLLFCGVLLNGWAPGAFGRDIHYPRSDEVWRTAYPVELLTRALALSDKPYRVLPSDYEAPKARNFLNLSQRRHVEVVWSMTSREREAHHRPVRIPLNRGLMGHRLALVRASDADLLAPVRDLQGLRQFTAGQMYVWTDTRILTGNDITVVPGSSYEALFRMLAAGRFDYFPRAVTEVQQELVQNQPLGLALDRHLILRYPTAMYFFVHQDDLELAADLEAGLEQMIRSGEFAALFERHFGELIRQLNLPGRRIINLHNPLLPAETPLCRRELWFSDYCGSTE